jgi:hypothetical protein
MVDFLMVDGSLRDGFLDFRLQIGRLQILDFRLQILDFRLQIADWQILQTEAGCEGGTPSRQPAGRRRYEVRQGPADRLH